MARLRNLRKSLAPELLGARRVSVLAVGSSLRGDDAAGILTAQYLQRKISPALSDRVQVLFGETAPENLSGPIRAFGPSHLVVIDAIDCGSEPGAVVMHKVERGDFNASCSTHGLPLRLLIEYLSREVGCQAIILGIQAATRQIAAPPTPAIRASARQLSNLLGQLLATSDPEDG